MKLCYVSEINTNEIQLKDGVHYGRIEVFRVGKWKHPTYGWIKADLNMFENMIKNWKNKVIGRELSFDFHHRPEWGAAAWVKDLKIEGDRLVAYVEFTPKGYEAVKNKEYLYFSPEYVENYIDKEDPSRQYGPTLLGGGFTNTPFLTNLAPIAISKHLEDKIKCFCFSELCDESCKLTTIQTPGIHTPQYIKNFRVDYAGNDDLIDAWNSIVEQYNKNKDKSLLNLAWEIFKEAKSRGIQDKLKGSLANKFSKIKKEKLEDVFQSFPNEIEIPGVISLIGSYTQGKYTSDLDLHIRWTNALEKVKKELCRLLPIELSPVHFVTEEKLLNEEPLTKGIPLYKLKLERYETTSEEQNNYFVPLSDKFLLKLEGEIGNKVNLKVGDVNITLDEDLESEFKNISKFDHISVKGIWTPIDGIVLYDIQKLEGKELIDIVELRNQYLEKLDNSQNITKRPLVHFSEAFNYWNKGYDYAYIPSEDKIIPIGDLINSEDTWDLCWSTSLKFFHPKGYDPTKVRDDQLRDDMRIAVAHLSNMDKGKKSMFSSKEEGLDFLKRIIEEAIKRDIITFHPENWSSAAKKYMTPVISSLTKNKIEIEKDQIDNLLKGKVTKDFLKKKVITIVIDKKEDLSKLTFISDGNKIYGIIRCFHPYKKDGKFLYIVRDFIPFKNPTKDVKARLIDTSGIQLANKNEIKIDLGCGNNKPDGYIGVDIVYYPCVDILWDCSKGLPFPDNFADEIRAFHFLEHLEDQDKIMWEIWRVLKPEGKFIFEIPSTKTEGAFACPDHKSYWNKSTFYFYSQPELAQGRPLFNIIELREETRGNLVYVNGILTPVKFKGDKRLVDVMSDIKLFEPFQKFDQLPKPAMKIYTEFFNVDELWNKWGSKLMEQGRKFAAENKLNGFRTFIQKKGNKVSLFFEDSQKERDLPGINDFLLKIKDDFALDTNVGIDKKGKPLPRIKIMKLLGKAEEKLEPNEIIKVTAFDIVYWNEDLTDLPFIERRKKLEEFYKKYLSKDPHFGISEMVIIKDKKHLEKVYKKLGFMPQSEGVVLKALDSKYGFKPLTDWAKIKHMVEFKARVIDVKLNKNGTYSFRCGLLKGNSPYQNIVKYNGEELLDMGWTYNANFKASKGDIITVQVEELIPSEKNGVPVLDWLGALPVDVDKERDEPYFANQCIDLAKRGGIWQE